MPQPFNRDKVLGDLWASPELATALGKMEPFELREDLRQELFLVLCELPEDKLQGLSERGELRWYAVRVMLTMVKSDRSAFYNTHRKYREQMLDGNCYVLPGGDRLDDSLGRGIWDNGDNWRRNPPPGIIHHDETEPPPAIPAELAKFRLSEPGLEWVARLTEAWERLAPDAPEVLALYSSAAIERYEAEMIRLYIEHGENCAPIARATGILVRSVRYAVQQAKLKIRKQVTT